MSAHTPGPWDARNGSNAGNIGIVARGAADLFRVAYVPVLPGIEDEARANARLIAAAPDLLAALQEARSALSWPEHAGTFEVVDAALKKAVGE